MRHNQTVTPPPSHSRNLLGVRCKLTTRAGAAKPFRWHSAFRPQRGGARRPGGGDSRIDEHPAGARLYPDRRHARRHWALHRSNAARCVCGLRFLPPSGRGCGFSYGGHLLQFAVPHGGARQREVHGPGRHGRAAHRRVPVSGADLQAGVPRRFPLAHRTGRVSHRGRVSGRHRDARRHVRRHGALASRTRSDVGDLSGPATGACSDTGTVHPCGRQHPARQSHGPATAGFVVRRSRDDRGERGVPLCGARHRGHWSGPRGATVDRATQRDLERNPGGGADSRLMLRDDNRTKRRDIAYSRCVIASASTRTRISSGWRKRTPLPY
jgi:hypothetical protein